MMVRPAEGKKWDANDLVSAALIESKKACIKALMARMSSVIVASIAVMIELSIIRVRLIINTCCEVEVGGGGFNEFISSSTLLLPR